MGYTSLDLYSIYMKKDHVELFRWVALSNLGKKFDQVSGFLKFSVQLSHAKDQQITLSKEEIKGDGSEMKIILPPQIQMKGHQLVVRVIKGEFLRKMDFMGTIDPFVQVDYVHMKETKIIKNNQRPQWKQEIKVRFNYVE